MKPEEEGKNEEKKTVDVLVTPEEVVPVAPEPRKKITCTLCVPSSEHHDIAIYEHVRDFHKGYYYSRTKGFCLGSKDSPGPGVLSRGPGLAKPAVPGAAQPPAKKKFSLNIGLKLNLSILDGLGKLAEDKEAFTLDTSDLQTLKEAYDSMGGILTTDDPRIAILVINAKVVIPGIIFNWDKFVNNIKNKFKGIFKKNIENSLEATLKNSAARRAELERKREQERKTSEEKAAAEK